MKSTKSLISSILGGIGILAGFGMLLTGCSDDDDKKPTVEITKAQLDQCCKDADNYEACVKDYQTNGVCSGYKEPGPVAEYGVPPIDEPVEYGPIDAPEYGTIDPGPTPEEIADCCGEDNGSEEYKECVADYKKSGACAHHQDEPVPEYGMIETPMYGMPDDPTPVNPDDEKIKECCGDDNGSDEYKECVEDYQKAGTCVKQPEPPIPEYGMPEPMYGMPDDPEA
ncbi:MAG: hypothetical protein J6A01_08465 [Proteobacteria bacterium]|nr:hypothetical protein [Pseudomonadota bacterium]